CNATSSANASSASRRNRGSASLSGEVDEAEGFVAVGDACVAQRGAPVAGDTWLRLLHPVIRHEEEGRALPHAGALDAVEDLTDASVAVADRRHGDVGVWPAFV